MDSERGRAAAAVARLRLALRSALSTAASTEDGVSFIRNLAMASCSRMENEGIGTKSTGYLALSFLLRRCFQVSR